MSDHHQSDSLENPCKDYWAFKRKRKREQKKLTKADTPPPKSPKRNVADTPSHAHVDRPKVNPKRWKGKDIADIEFFTPTIAIDLSFGAQMNDKRLRSLAAQVGYSYASVKAHPRPCALVLTSVVEGAPITRFLQNIDGWSTWKVFKEADPVEKKYPIEKLVYLTPDSENLLEAIDHDKVYVIGGIVDDNQLKNLSLSKATTLGIAHARLPIKEKLPNFRNQSLNVNHIVEILLNLGEGIELEKALEMVVPRRYTSPKASWKPNSTNAAEKDPEDVESKEDASNTKSDGNVEQAEGAKETESPS